MGRTQRECDPDLCLHVSGCRPPSSRVLVTQNVLVCSAERACTRERLRYVFNGLTAVARSRLRPGVLDSEKNAVAATSGSKLVSTRSDSALGQPLGQNGNGARIAVACAAFVAWPIGSSWVGRLRQGTYQEASVHPRVRRRGEMNDSGSLIALAARFTALVCRLSPSRRRSGAAGCMTSRCASLLVFSGCERFKSGIRCRGSGFRFCSIYRT